MLFFNPSLCSTAGENYQYIVETIQFRPECSLPHIEIPIDIFNDALSEGNEQLTIELTSYELSIILVEKIVEVVITDNDSKCNVRVYILTNDGIHCCNSSYHMPFL